MAYAQNVGPLLPAFSVLGQNASVLVTPAQLTVAGFTDVQTQVAETGSNRFLPPNYYFHVKETLDATHAQEWGDAARMVAVLVEPKISPDLMFNNGKVEVHTLDGRTQAFLTTSQYYIEATGPVADKTIALVSSLGELYK